MHDEIDTRDNEIKSLKKQIEDLKAENERLNNYIRVSDRMIEAYLKAQK